jgi:hypothetical protein
MAISGTIRLLTASTNLSTFDLYSCTSSSNSSCSGNAFETNISKNDLLNGFPSNLIDDGTQYVKIKSNAGDCINQYIIVQLNGAPALGTTPTPTATPSVALPGCGDTISDSYTPSGNTIQTHYLDLTNATNGDTITLHYTANERPDRFNIYDNSNNLIVNSGWVGSDNTYAGPWGTAGSLVDADGDGYMNFTYNSSKTYKLTVDVGPANPSNILSDGWTVTIACTSTPTPTVYTIDLSFASPVDSCGVACSNYYTAPLVTYYSLTNSFAINTYLYTTSACTTPVNAGYYSQGANCLTVNVAGKITATGACSTYWYYDMTDCTTLTAKVGRSTVDLATLTPSTALIGPYNCSLVHTDRGRTAYYEAYDYDLDTKTYVDNCSVSDCVAPPAYNTFSLTYNNGDFESNACPGNLHNQGPNNYYTNNTSTISNSTVLYANTSLAPGQEVADGYYYYGPSGKYYTVSGGNGILTDQTPC